MSAFYIMKYFGKDGAGGGTLYIGRGVVVGTDIQGAKFDGTYRVINDRMIGVVTMTSPASGSKLVTGQTLPPGMVVPLNFDFPARNFADGRLYPMTGYGEQPLMVAFEKVRDLPDEGNEATT
jgi:hypothetical protein